MSRELPASRGIANSFGGLSFATEGRSGVDDDRLAGHGLAAAQNNHHVGAVAFVSGLLQE
jgi:hypothetical protein